MKSKFLVNKSKDNYYSGDFVCFIKENGEIIVPGDDDDTAYAPEENDEEFHVEFRFRALDNAENNAILSQTLSLESDDIKMDVAQFNDLRMRAVLREWNLTDDEGEVLPIDNKNLNGLHPIIFNRIISIINEKLGTGIGM